MSKQIKSNKVETKVQPKSYEKKNQLSDPLNFNTKNIMFSDPVAGSVPDTPIVFKRINISVLNKDGTQGDLILPTGRCFSFGISQNTDPTTKEANGYSLPICLYNRDGASSEEKKWVETFNQIVEVCEKHLLDHKEDIEKYDLEKGDLKKLNPLYWRRDKGVIIPGTGPTLYPKLIVSSNKKKKGVVKEEDKKQKIVSMFFDKNDQPIDPVTLMGAYCYVVGAIKIESIFIGSKITLQVKLYEATIELVSTGMKSLLPRPNVKTSILTGKATTMNDLDVNPDELEESSRKGSVDNSDDEKDPHLEAPKEPVAPSTPVKKVIKRVVKKTQA